MAALLVNFVNKKPLDILLRWAMDEDSMVRVKAFDSLSVFEKEKVILFLRKAIVMEKNELACFYAQ